MDIERMEEIAAFIEALPACPHRGSPEWPPATLERSFDMGTWSFQGEEGSACGTTGCIAGWTVMHFGLIEKVEICGAWDPKTPKSWAAVAREYLGLDFDTARRLFVPYGEETGDVDMEEITPQQAAAAIRQTYQTGQPNWKLVLQTA